MKIGERIYTPRFCTVTIKGIYNNKENARADGFTEPTHYHSEDGYTILGKSVGVNQMIFAGVKE